MMPTMKIFPVKAAAIFNGYLLNGFNFKSQPSSWKNKKKKFVFIVCNFEPDLIYVMRYDCQWIKYIIKNYKKSPTKEKNKIIKVFPSFLEFKMFPLFHLHRILKLNFLGVNIHNIFCFSPASVWNEIIKLNKKGTKKKCFEGIFLDKSLLIFIEKLTPPFIAFSFFLWLQQHLEPEI